MLNIQELQAQIIAIMPDIRRTIAKVLRSSRYYGEDHIDDCMSEVMIQVLDYGVRSFDPTKGSLKPHFTSFAKMRAINWLSLAFHRFEAATNVTTDAEGKSASLIDAIETNETPFSLMASAQSSARIRAAIASLKPQQRDLLAAFERTMCWRSAAAEVGMSPAAASRMKAQIVAHLRG